jgi:hypothetical protein
MRVDDGSDQTPAEHYIEQACEGHNDMVDHDLGVKLIQLFTGVLIDLTCILHEDLVDISRAIREGHDN